MLKECEVLKATSVANLKISKTIGEISRFAQKIYCEIDKSYFGFKRVREKRGRGAANKTPVFLFRYAHSCKQTEC